MEVLAFSTTIIYAISRPSIGKKSLVDKMLNIYMCTNFKQLSETAHHAILLVKLAVGVKEPKIVNNFQKPIAVLSVIKADVLDLYVENVVMSFVLVDAQVLSNQTVW